MSGAARSEAAAKSDRSWHRAAAAWRYRSPAPRRQCRSRPSDSSGGAMLEEAALDDGERAGLSFLAADMRDWRTADPFDLVVAPCSSLSHLLTLEEPLAAWRCVYDNLTAGGRFTPISPCRTSPPTPTRCRCRPARSSRSTLSPRSDHGHAAAPLQDDTISAAPAARRDQVLYDRFPDGDRADRYVSNFACHVYYPREVELLFRITGWRWRRGSATTRCAPLPATVAS